MKPDQRRVVWLSVCAWIVLILAGCTSRPETASDAPPEWLLNPPRMPGYFIGVGSSNTGELSEDRLIAETRARVAVAGGISTQLRSELRIETSDGSLREAREELFEVTTSVVEQELPGVETVETFHHPEWGYWVLARLSRQRWESIQETERQRLRERVLSAIRGSQEDSTVREELQRLSTAWDLLRQSPHGSIVRGELYGAEGYLADAISWRYRQLLAGLSVRLEHTAITEEYDAVMEIAGSVSSEKPPGRIPLQLDGSVRSPGITEPEGSFRFIVPQEGRVSGDQTLHVSIATDRLPRLEPLSSPDSGQATVRLTLVKPPAGLRILYSGESDRGVAEQGIQRFISAADLPVEISESSSLPPTGYIIVAEIHIADLPRVVENAPLMSEGYLSFTVRRGETVLDTIRTDSQRDGGITREQAHGRLLSSLLRKLDANERYGNDLREIFR